MESTSQKVMTKEEFMTFFRNTETLNQLTVSDRFEVFETILLGSSDFTKELLEGIFSDYCVSHLKVIEVE